MAVIIWFGYVSLRPWVKFLKGYIVTILIEKYYKNIVIISVFFTNEYPQSHLLCSILYFTNYNITRVKLFFICYSALYISYILMSLDIFINRTWIKETWFMLIKSYMNPKIHAIITWILWFIVLSSIKIFFFFSIEAISPTN